MEQDSHHMFEKKKKLPVSMLEVISNKKTVETKLQAQQRRAPFWWQF